MIQDVIALEKIIQFNARKAYLNEYIISTLRETRRRSIRIWQTIPASEASVLNSMRRIFHQEFNCCKAISNRDNDSAAWLNKPFTDIQTEIDFARPFTQRFLDGIMVLTENELQTHCTTINNTRLPFISLLFQLNFMEKGETEEISHRSYDENTATQRQKN